MKKIECYDSYIIVDDEEIENVWNKDTFVGLVTTIYDYMSEYSDSFIVYGLENDDDKQTFDNYIHFYVKYKDCINHYLIGGKPTQEQLRIYDK